MVNIECNGGRLPSAIKTKDGNFWFPTMGGVAIIDPEAETVNPNPPPTIIEDVSIDRKSVEKLQSAIELKPNQTSLEIHYTGLSLVKSKQIKFRYKLEGLDKNWIEAGTNRTANYSYLPAGNYTFRVVAANSGGVWNTEGASVRIVVYPVFYQIWWFLTLAVLAVGLVIWLIYHKRVSQLRKIAAAKSEFSRRLIESQEAERKRIAAELHDGLGQSLAIISNRAAMGKNKKNEPESVFREFDEISKDALDALGKTVRLLPRNSVCLPTKSFPRISRATAKPMSLFGDLQTEIGLSCVRKISRSSLSRSAQTATRPRPEITTATANLTQAFFVRQTRLGLSNAQRREH